MPGRFLYICTSKNNYSIPNTERGTSGMWDPRQHRYRPTPNQECREMCSSMQKNSNGTTSIQAKQILFDAKKQVKRSTGTENTNKNLFKTEGTLSIHSKSILNIYVKNELSPWFYICNLNLSFNTVQIIFQAISPLTYIISQQA